MEGDIPSAIISAKQQKSIRLDALSARLVKSKQANGLSALYAENRSLPKQFFTPEPGPSANMGPCLKCRNRTSDGNYCDACTAMSLPGAHIQPHLRVAANMICPVCTTVVYENAATARVCSSCKKMVHRECDRESDPGLDDFVCGTCRSSPLVGDAMLAAPPSPLGYDSGGGPSFSQMRNDSATLFRSTSPIAQMLQTNAEPEFNDMYTMSEGISSPATTSDSTRHSPFMPENSPSDVDEDFVPGRGGYRGRSGKKKPGRGQGLMKTRSGGKPPSGVFSDKLGQSTRGKRGKRGANKMSNGKGPGRGRGRGRGGSTGMNSYSHNTVLQQILLQQHQQQQASSMIREVDEAMLEENGRCPDRSEEPEYVRTVVICNAKDQFIQRACLCLVCGSVGKGPESSMVACSNCAQTYHTYCVGLHDKLNQPVVFRGWRCLDCTVCEGCGEGKDESKLLLCEECDVSFHIYCLDPPLDKIPNGPWRCKWCARCRHCNMRVSSGTDLTREGLCITCHSLRKCPKCVKLYQLGDKIFRCSQCVRWYHGTCVDLYNDEMLESAAANKTRCYSCRPSVGCMSNMIGLGDHSNMIVCDGVALNKIADEILQSKFMPGAFRPSPLENFGYRSESFDHFNSIDEDYLANDDLEMMSSGRGRGMGRGGGPGRRVPKLGVGGFFVKIPRHRALTTDEDPLDDEGNKKLKRPRKPRRSQLEDAYPPQIQEGFFGGRAFDGKTLIDAQLEEPQLDGEHSNGQRVPTFGGHELSHEASEMLRNDLTERSILESVDLGDVNIDDMDFSNWMDDDDGDGDLDDSMNDAYDFIKSDGYDPTAKESQQSSSSSMPTSYSNEMPMPMIPPAPYVLPSNGQSLSRSSSQMDSTEKSNPTMERWEEDEPLGSGSTKAAVLYANEKHDYLKTQFPEWNDRVKQIQRLWRTLGSEERHDFVNRARENRASRGKQPRARKINATTSVDSPTIQSPAPFYRQPNMMSPMSDERFKVPTMPPHNMGMVPGPSHRPDFFPPGQLPHPHMQIKQEPGVPQQQLQHPPQTIKVLCHLDPNTFEQYDLLRRRADDLKKQQDNLDQELSRMRKQKKNLAAKKRQMIKSAGMDADGRPNTVDLNATDRDQMEQLQTVIPARQKELEQCKKDTKNHTTAMTDFETKHQILRPAPSDPAECARLQQVSFPLPRVPVGIPNGPMPPPGHPHAHLGGPPPGMPGHPHPHQHPHGPPNGAGFHMNGHPHMHPQFQMRVPQQVQYGMMQAPPLGAQMHQMRPMHRMMMRAPVLGGQPFDRLQTQLDREVYETVDFMINQLCMAEEPPMMDMSRDMNGGNMLKRMLEPSHQLAALGGMPGGGPGGHLGDLEPPRHKKKRTQPKKAESKAQLFQPGQTGNEYDLMVERVQTQLRLCTQLPRQALEPAPRNPGACFAVIGMSDLCDRPGKRTMSGHEIGNMSLTFLEDFFFSEERGPKGVAGQCPPPMANFCLMPDQPMQYIQQMIGRLNQANLPEAPEYLADKEDVQFGLFDVMASIASTTGRHAVHPHYRTVGKVPDVPQPLEPHRSVFHMERESVEEVEVSVVMRAEQQGDVVGALEQLRQMLGMEQPIDYNMDTPPLSPDAADIVAAGASPAVNRGVTVKMEPMDPQPCAGGRCRACDANMQAVKMHSTMSQLGLTPSDDDKDDTVYFCSMKCYYQFVAASKVALSPDQLTQAESHVDEETLAKLRQISAESFAKCINQGKMLPAVPSLPSETLLTSPRDTRYVIDEGKRDNLQIIRVSDLAQLQEVTSRRESSSGPGEDWKVYNKETLSQFLKIQSAKQELVLSPKMGVCFAPTELDRRQCLFCGGIGDADTNICGRLLNLGANTWVHVNCALWSAEVYENPNGGLLHVDGAVVRSLHSVCNQCGRTGASLQCHKADCGMHFHLPCARKIAGKFVKDRTFFCPRHHDIAPEMVVHQLDSLRRIFIERNETMLLATLFEHTDGPPMCMRLGAFGFYNLGQLLPDQLKAFHTPHFIYPNGYFVTRWFWSPSDPKTRLQFKCGITERNHRPLFTIESFDPHHERISFESETPTGAWRGVLSAVEKVREQTISPSALLRFFPNSIQGETLFGLNENAVNKIIESLPGVDGLFSYTFRQSGQPLELPLAINPSGCARCEPRFRTLVKHKTRAVVHAHNDKPSTSRSSNSLPEGRTRGAKAPSSFTDELAAQMKLFGGGDWTAIGNRLEPIGKDPQSYSFYQKMRREWPQTCHLARSKIQGLGLFAKRDINMGDMIIEYKGEVIRSEVGEVREKRYDAESRGVYMFRIDEDLIIDATMKGGPARYVNHSCDPNCSTRILSAGQYPEDKKIIITANRPITQGEELTYDYQFEYEDAKIPCLCGAPNCNKWMN